MLKENKLIKNIVVYFRKKNKHFYIRLITMTIIISEIYMQKVGIEITKNTTWLELINHMLEMFGKPFYIILFLSLIWQTSQKTTRDTDIIKKKEKNE